MSEYLPRCIGRLEGLLRAMQEPLTKRHAYLDNLILALGRPLEVDTVHARYAALQKITPFNTLPTHRH